MANDAGFAFIQRELPDSLAGLTVVEVGSLVSHDNDMRPLALERHPAEYVGFDVIAGDGVDKLGTVERLTAATGVGIADVVLCAEVMEHVRDWRAAISEMKEALKPAGLLLITTRSPGYPFHASPFDFWRYAPEDGRAIMADMDDVVIEADPSAPGVFISARKPADWKAMNLSVIELTSVLTGHRELDIRDRWIWRKRFSSPRRIVSFLLPHDLKARLLGTRVGSRLR